MYSCEIPLFSFVGKGILGVVPKTNTLSSNFRPFFNCQLLSDVTFVIQEQKFYAHKLVLAARSPYFYQLILVSCKHTNTLEIEIQDALPSIFYRVMEYMYTDTTVIQQDTVWDIFQAAKFYQVSDLMKLCEEFIISILNETNVFEIWKKSQQLSVSHIAQHCALYVRNRYSDKLTRANISLQSIEPHSNPETIFSIIESNQFAGKSQNTSVTRTKEEKKIEGNLYTELQNYSFPGRNNNIKPQKEDIKGKSPSVGTSSSIKQEDVQEEINDENNDNNDDDDDVDNAIDADTTTNNQLISIEKQKTDEKGKFNLVQQQQNEPMFAQTFELWSQHNIPPAAFPTPESLAAFPQFFRVDDIKSTSEIQKGKEVKDNEKELPKLCRRLSVIADPENAGMFCQHLISAITKLLEAERTTMFIYDKTTDELCSQVAIGESEIRIPSDKGIAGSVFKSGKQVNVTDAYSNSKFNANVDKNTGFVTRHVLCSPLLGKDGTVIGVIEVLNKQTEPFNIEDENHLRTAASLLSIFLFDQCEILEANDKNNPMKSSSAIPNSLSKQVLLLNPSKYRNQKQEDLLSFIFEDVEDISELLNESTNDPLLYQGLNSLPSLSNIDNNQNNDNDNTKSTRMQQIDFATTVQSDTQQSLRNPTPPTISMMSLLNSEECNTNHLPQNLQNNATNTSFRMEDNDHNNNNTQKGNIATNQVTVPSQPKKPSVTFVDNTFINESPNYYGIPKKETKAHPAPANQKKTGTGTVTGKKRKRENTAFMHFRIPRYELQFIQFDAEGQKKSNK